jgi:ferric-dicitrate binding protein FerR (iron transport regulator)
MKCRKAKNLFSLYVAPDESWLSPEERQALEGHMAACEACRRDCQESRVATELLRECWQISDDTAALLRDGSIGKWQGSSARILSYFGSGRRVAGWAVAACLAVTVLGGWALLGRCRLWSGTGRTAAQTGERLPFTIRSAEGGHVATGAVIQTSAGEMKHLVVDHNRRLVMNAESRLSIEPFVEAGKPGVLVNLAQGEVFAHVEHDGNPFVVQTAHGRAVITGTTFDVKTTVAATTLVVVEGSVRLESEAHAVQVGAGQRATLAAGSERPSSPAVCDATILIAWTRPGQNASTTAQIASSLLEDLPAIPATGVSIDLARINYAQWVDENRDWFSRQFPWVFELKEALAKEGTDVDYPDLLVQSGDIWRFAFPGVALSRRIDPDPDCLLRVAARHGRDESWLRQQGFTLLPRNGRESPVKRATAFVRWADVIEARAKDCMIRDDSPAFSESLDASLYLVNTRTLAALVMSYGPESVGARTRRETLDLLRTEIQTLDALVRTCRQIVLTQSRSNPHEDVERTRSLTDGIRRLARLDRRIRELAEAPSGPAKPL